MGWGLEKPNNVGKRGHAAGIPLHLTGRKGHKRCCGQTWLADLRINQPEPAQAA
jgi:hypothetical protein